MTIPSLIQTCSNTGSGVSSINATFGSPNSNGNWLIAYGSAGSGGASFTFSDSTNGNYWKVNQGISGSIAQAISIIPTASINNSGSGATVTMADGVTATQRMIVEEWSGIDLTNIYFALDQIVTVASGTGTTASLSTGTLAEAGELVVCSVSASAGVTWSSSNLTLGNTANGTGRMSGWALQTGTGVFTPSFTLSSSATWAMIAVVLRSAKARKVISLSGSTFAAPSDFPGIADRVDCWGGGGAGTSAHKFGVHQGLGGGGGAYAYAYNVAMSNGTTIQIGTGGSTDGASGQDTWAVTSGTVLAKAGNGPANGGTSGTGGAAASCIPSTQAFSGGQGGASVTNTVCGGTGGGGAGGPYGAGANGGAQSATGSNGGTGGGGSSGGTIGANQTASTQGGTTGGNAGSPNGAVASTGGPGGASGANNGSAGGTNTAGTSGGAGGGGGGSDGAGGGGGGGIGASGVEAGLTPLGSGAAGSGGGGGATGGITSGSSPLPGAGGSFGGGGGGGGNGTFTGFAAGGVGGIVVTYTPANFVGMPLRISSPAKFFAPPRSTDNAVFSPPTQPPYSALPPVGPGIQPNAQQQFLTPPRSNIANIGTIAPVSGLMADHSLLFAPISLAIKQIGFIPAGGPVPGPFNNLQFQGFPYSVSNPVNPPTNIGGLSISISTTYGSLAGSAGVIPGGLLISNSTLLGPGQTLTAGAAMTGLSVSCSLIYAPGAPIGVLSGIISSNSLVQTSTIGQVIQPLVPMTAVQDVRLRIGYQPWRVNKDDVIG